MNAVLFDFSGTLFRIESTESWLRAVLRETGVALPEPELAEAARALESAGAMPGGARPERLPAEFAEIWAIKDESAELHRAAFTGVSAKSRSPTRRCTTRCTTGT